MLLLNLSLINTIITSAIYECTYTELGTSLSACIYYVEQAIWRKAEKISGSSWDLNPGPFDF